MKEKENGLTAAQKKLPPALQAAILKKKGHKKDVKHMDAEDVEARDIDKNGEIDGWEVGKANAIKKGLMKKKGDKPSEEKEDKEDQKDESVGRIPTFLEWVKIRESR